jgi:hypothetical protein
LETGTGKKMKKIALLLKTPITFEEAKNIKAPVKHYITRGGSNYIDSLIIEEQNSIEVIACLMQIGVEIEKSGERDL